VVAWVLPVLLLLLLLLLLRRRVLARPGPG
jgi:hypothetical protein